MSCELNLRYGFKDSKPFTNFVNGMNGSLKS